MTERILYFDLVGGAAGDMVLAALLDLGASLDTVKAAWAKVGLDRVTAKVVPVDPAGLRALSLDVFVDGQLADADVPEGSSMAVAPPHEHDADHRHAHHDHGHAHHDHDDSHAHHGHRPYAAIRALLAEADLPKPVIDRAQDAFWRLAEAEGKAHGIDPAEVVFHEVGSDDAIADILGVATAWHELAIDRVVVSPFPLGHGLTRGGHGPIPLPGPATLHLLEGAPTVGVPLNGETVTPTGAAVLTSLADAYGLSPAMVVQRTGTGAGHKRWPDRPNVVRAVLGEASTASTPSEEDLVVEANIDDMRPEDLRPLLDALFAAGAADAWAVPLYMKKGRPGLQVCALTRRTLEPAIVETFFLHSPTLGVRMYEVRRQRAERRMITVNTDFGEIRVKLTPRPDGSVLAAPEHDDCVDRASAAGISTRRVYEAALQQAWSKT